MATAQQVLTKRQKLELQRAQLDAERQSFMSQWRDLGDYILPTRPRWSVSDRNRGERRNQKILDSTATLALRTLASGMMAGMTSPARPWFRLTTPDPELAEAPAVKSWLHEVNRRMADQFLKSNLYNELAKLYKELPVFGTAPMFFQEDFEQVFRATSFPIGSYWIATDEDGRVRVFRREFRMTVRQLVEKFGRQPDGEIDWTDISHAVKSLWLNGQLEDWVEVAHVVTPNEDYDPAKSDSRSKLYYSCYYERGVVGSSDGRADADGQLLRESGYDYFPVFCPRWDVSGEDVYATDCPGMTALGDIKQLMKGESRSLQAIDKMANPPVTAPTTLRNSTVNLLPGGVTYADDQTEAKGIRPTYQVDPRIRELSEKQGEVRQRIRRAFYEDLFLLFVESDRRDITAEEIRARMQEKLLVLGPVLEQLNQDLLDPLVDAAFMIMDRQGLIPPPPEELMGQPLKVEYISIMAQAQKAAGLASLERFTSFVIGVSQAQPSVLDKLDADQLVDEYADVLGVPPRVVRPDEAVAGMREARAQQTAIRETAEVAAQGAKAAKDMAGAKLEEDNALKRLMDQSRAGQLVRTP